MVQRLSIYKITITITVTVTIIQNENEALDIGQ